MSSAPDLNQTLISAFLEHIPFSVYFKDRDSRFIATSATHARRHGLTRAQMIGKTDADLHGPEHAARTRADEERIMATGEPILRKLERRTLPDGSVCWNTTTKLPLRDDSGTIIGTFGLSKDVTAERQTEEALDKARKELLSASHQAGMAEVATGVLHNVGNVLNSVNVSTALVADGLRHSKAANLVKAGELLAAHADDLPDFIANDPKGHQLPAYIQTLGAHLIDERDRLLAEIHSLQQNIDHIKDIVAMQQTYAMQGGLLETLDPADLVEDALRLNTAALSRHDVQVVRDFAPAPRVTVEKVCVLQILVNLIRNAKYAMDDAAPPVKTLRIAIRPGDTPGWVAFAVIDNGVGIPAENLEKIFLHGFTTRRGGHGFGLHTSILAAKKLGGRLDVASPGHLQGASFTLHLPPSPPEA